MFGAKKTTQRSRAGSQISTMSSSMNYLVVKVGLGGFQGKFKLLWLRRHTHASACVGAYGCMCVVCGVCTVCVCMVCVRGIWCVRWCEVCGVYAVCMRCVVCEVYAVCGVCGVCVL